MVVEIPLTRGFVALVDDQDAEKVQGRKWHAHHSDSRVYAGREERDTVTGAKRFVYMHRVIAGASDSMQVDHKNHETLDNRRENLRLCTTSENQRNQRRVSENRSSLFKGVHFYKARQKWTASIMVNGSTIHLGYYTDEIAAAKAYDAAAREHFGEFAYVNFEEESQ